MNTAKDIFRELNEIFSYFGTDIANDERNLWTKYLSRGKNFSEFIDGVFQFLSAIGYEEDRFNIPFRDFIRDLTKRDLSGAVMSGYSFVKSLKSQAPSSKRLSKTIRDYITQFHEMKKPSTVSLIIIDAIPRLMYPVLANTIPDLESSYNDISDCIELGFVEMNEENFSILLSCMTIIESLLTEFSPHDRELSSKAFKEIVAAHMPMSSPVDWEAHLVAGLTSYLKKTNSKCSYQDGTCFQRFRAHINFQALPFEYKRKTSTTELSKSGKLIDSVIQLLIAYVMAFSETLEDSVLAVMPMAEEQYEFTFRKIKDHMKAVIDILNDSNENIPEW